MCVNKFESKKMVVAIGSYHHQHDNCQKKDQQDKSTKSSSQEHFQQSQRCQELIGNSKEFRLDTNNHHIRIIGNANKICLNQNNGNLEVIGNMTRIKCVKNCGTITYTGNNGKVYLGKESKIQQIDYIGNCGQLKLVNSTELKERLNIVKKSAASSSTGQEKATATATKTNKSPPTDNESKSNPIHNDDVCNDNQKFSTSNNCKSSSNDFSCCCYRFCCCCCCLNRNRIRNKNKTDNNEQIKAENSKAKTTKTSSTNMSGDSTGVSSNIHFENAFRSGDCKISLNIQNNISLPNLNVVSLQCNERRILNNSLKITSNSTENIVVSNSIVMS